MVALIRDGGPDAGPDRPRRVRPALRDRGAADAGEPEPGPPDPRAPANDRRTGRRRDRRRRSGGRGARGPARAAGGRGRRLRASAGLALAGGRRVRVAGRGRGAAAGRSGRGDAGRGRPADPRDARRDASAGRRSGSPTAPKTAVRPAVGFDRSRLDPALLDLADVPGRTSAAGWRVDRGRPRTPAGSRSASRTARRGRRARPRSWSGRTVRIRSWRASGRRRPAGPARPARRADLSPRRPGDPDPAPARDARMRILRDGYVGIAPVPGGRVNIGIVLGRSWREAPRAGRARAPSRPTSSRPSRRPPTTPRPGATANRCDTRSRAPGRSVIGSPGGRAEAGCSSATRRASSIRSPGRASTGRSSRPNWRPPRSRARGRGRPGAFAAYERAMAPPVPRQGRRLVARPGVPRPAGALRLRRPPRRRRGRVRATMGLVMGDLIPAGRALDPRYLARCSRHDGDERTRVAAYAICLDEAGPHPPLPHRAVGRRRARSGRCREAASNSASRPRRAVLRELAEEAGYNGEVVELADVSDRLFSDPDRFPTRADGAEPPARDPDRLPGPHRRRRAARRGRRLDRHVRWFTPEAAARLHLGELARRALRFVPELARRRAPEARHAQHDRDRRRSAARPRLRAGPRRRALGAAPPPLRPLARRRAARRRLARRRLHRSAAVRSSASSGSACR